MNRKKATSGRAQAPSKTSIQGNLPSSSTSTSSLSWYAGISAMTISPITQPGLHFASPHSSSGSTAVTIPPGTVSPPMASPTSSYTPRPLSTEDFASSSASLSSSPSLTLPLPTNPRRHQSIPISFLIHPTSASPRRQLSPADSSSPSPASSPSLSPSQPASRYASPPFPLPNSSVPNSTAANSTLVYDEDVQLSRTGYSRAYVSPLLQTVAEVSLSYLPGRDVYSSSAHVRHHELRGWDARMMAFDMPDPQAPLASLFQPSQDHIPAAEEAGLSVVSVMVGSEDDTVMSADDGPRDDQAGEGQEEDEEDGGEQADGSHRRPVSLRRTTNPNLKTTKTGKIQHKPKKVGVSKKTTAYNRFLQQQSKYYAKYQSHLTPQQRMKIIADEWKVSEKNQHKTRRKSSQLPNGGTTETTQGQHQQRKTLSSQSSIQTLSSLTPPQSISAASLSTPMAINSLTATPNTQYSNSSIWAPQHLQQQQQQQQQHHPSHQHQNAQQPQQRIGLYPSAPAPHSFHHHQHHSRNHRSDSVPSNVASPSSSTSSYAEDHRLEDMRGLS